MWVILFASFAMNFLTGVIDPYGVVYVELIDYFQDGHALAAWPGAIFGSVMSLSGPLVSAVSNKFGLRVVALTGCLLVTGGFVISSFANGIPMLCVGYGVLVGTGISFVDITVQVSVATYFRNRLNFALAISTIGISVGSFVWPPVMEVMMRAYTWKGALLMCAAFGLQSVVFAALLKPAAKQSHVDNSATDDDDSSKNESDLEMAELLNQDKESTEADKVRRDEQATDGSKMSGRSIEMNELSAATPTTSKCNLYLFRNINFCFFLMTHSLCMATVAGYLNGITDCAYRNDIPMNQAVFLVSAIGIAGLVTQGIQAALGHRLSAVLMFMACIFSLLVSYALISSITDSYVVYVISSAIQGGAGGVYLIVSPVVLAQVCGVDHMATALGYSRFFKGVTSTVLYPLQGGIYDLMGSYTPAWILFIVLNVISMFTIGLMWRNMKRMSKPLRNNDEKE